MGAEQNEKKRGKIPFVMTIPMICLGLFALFAGFPKEIFFNYLDFDIDTHHALLSYIPLIVSIMGILTAWVIYDKRYIESYSISRTLRPIYRTLVRKYWLDDVYIWLYSYILNGVSYICGWFDRYLVEGFVNFTVWNTRKTSQKLRGIQSGSIQNYLYGIILAVIILFCFTILTPAFSRFEKFTTQFNPSKVDNSAKGDVNSFE
jgi:NADH-quinone oxidoreductase subunit L